MPEQISDRHESDLGGRFLPFGETNRVDITIVVPAAAAAAASTQHAAWMLLNLLARQQGVVQRLGLVCPSSVPLAGRIVPLAPRIVDLRTALMLGAEAIGVVPVDLDSSCGRRIVIGTHEDMSGQMYVVGNGWTGGISTIPTPKPNADGSRLPFGPYVAACLAAGEIFKAARIRPESYESPQSAFYSMWDHKLSTTFESSGPAGMPVEVHAALAGVGAVGSAALHALWACDDATGRIALADNDRRGVEGTNLNRYPLFGQASVSQPKAKEAARILADAAWECDPHDVPIQDFEPFPSIVLSAVDSNRSRAAIQNRYPSRILSASTHDLRAESLRCGPPGVGACLRCYNPPEEAVPDDTVRDAIRKMSDAEVDRMAQASKLTTGEVRDWASSGKCGMAGEKVLSQFRQTQEQRRDFAVGFVSVMAGTMLAAEAVKMFGRSDAPRAVGANRALFQFWKPMARTNTPSMLERDPRCPMCRPDAIATQIWVSRYSESSPA